MFTLKETLKSIKDQIKGYIHFLTIRIKLSKGDTNPQLFEHENPPKEKKDD